MHDMTRRSFFGAGALASLSLASCMRDDGGQAAPAGEPEPAETPAPTPAPQASFDPELVAAAQAEGELVVYASCPESLASLACDRFTSLFGIETRWASLEEGEVMAKLAEEDGSPSADVWFGGGVSSFLDAAELGMLERYEPAARACVRDASLLSDDGTWVAFSYDPLGLVVATDALEQRDLPIPEDWADLTDASYAGLVVAPGYATSEGALLARAAVQTFGRDDAMSYLAALDANVSHYASSPAAAVREVGEEGSLVGIGLVSDGAARLSGGTSGLALVVPASGTSERLDCTAIFAGARNTSAARLWVEYALSTELASLMAGSGLFRVPASLDGEVAEVLVAQGVDAAPVTAWDADDVRSEGAYAEEALAAIGGARGAEDGEDEDGQ